MLFKIYLNHSKCNFPVHLSESYWCPMMLLQQSCLIPIVWNFYYKCHRYTSDEYAIYIKGLISMIPWFTISTMLSAVLLISWQSRTKAETFSWYSPYPLSYGFCFFLYICFLIYILIYLNILIPSFNFPRFHVPLFYFRQVELPLYSLFC